MNSSNSNYILLVNFPVSYHCNKESKSKINKPNLCGFTWNLLHKVDGMELVYEDAEIISSLVQVNHKHFRALEFNWIF